MANVNKKATKVITGICRLSYEHVWEPSASVEGAKPKYSASLIIPKADKETIDAINKAIDAAIEEGTAKFGGKTPNKASIKLPLRDGDEREDEAYAGSYFVNANSLTKPQIVDKNVHEIFDKNEVYSGCYVRASLNFYCYAVNGNKGVACGLGNIQKVDDGPFLGGRSSAAQDFTSMADDDFLK